MNLKYIMMIGVLALAFSCTTSPKQITSSKDYMAYLEPTDNMHLNMAQEEVDFWHQKLKDNPNQFPYLAKLGSAYATLFAITGKIEHLKQAENAYLKVNGITNYENSSYLKALATNYISQHKFKEALSLLKKAESNGDKLEDTQKMLFDVYLELGNYELAKDYLNRFQDTNDFDYLIRLSKWSDHRGDLETAIKFMEQATTIAESSNLPGLKLWAYTNLADFYGHAGHIETSYAYFLKALELDPNDAYAKKGIAWIVYSHEKNPDEALRILNTVTETFFAPDYYLLKAEIAEYKEDQHKKSEHLNLYLKEMEDMSYGDMYNAYNVMLLAEDNLNSKKAITLAATEIENRPTPRSYDLMAWAYYKNGHVDMALDIVESHVANQTFEPEALYHIAEIYKANGKNKKAKNLKKELLESSFELGPLMAKNIKNI
ncbi:tetratricopeptide repeat protein [Changchengzhania lutea]|uniref:tetratricopeptide repeat protein n=1 Tax=Changchengzhania lutea TaxID=2049305 RepID=UPI001FE55B16|nr:cell surface protein [Changchengzhania lutea]